MASSTDNQNVDGGVNVEQEGESDNTSSDNGDDTEKREDVVDGETKLSKGKLRKLKRKENALKYRHEKRSVSFSSMNNMYVTCFVQKDTKLIPMNTSLAEIYG